MSVQATVVDSCSVTAGALNFGTLNLNSTTGVTTTNNQSTSVSYSCIAGGQVTNLTVGQSLNANAAPAGAFPAGYNYVMTNSTKNLFYGLDVEDNSATFTAADAATGTTATAPNVVGSKMPFIAGTSGSFTISGSVSPGQTVVVGTYSDSVPFTITY